MQDRERFLALPLVPEAQHSNNPSNNNHHQNPPGSGGAVPIVTSTMGALKVGIINFFK